MLCLSLVFFLFGYSYFYFFISLSNIIILLVFCMILTKSNVFINFEVLKNNKKIYINSYIKLVLVNKIFEIISKQDVIILRLHNVMRFKRLVIENLIFGLSIYSICFLFIFLILSLLQRCIKIRKFLLFLLFWMVR